MPRRDPAAGRLLPPASPVAAPYPRPGQKHRRRPRTCANIGVPVRLASLRLVGLPPFGDVSFPFTEDDGGPRPLTVLFGAGGVGKTTVLSALGATRPGYAVAIGSSSEAVPSVVSEWSLGADDAHRPHPLVIATPTAKVQADDTLELLRRREQAHFDRVAKDGGFVFVSIPSTRWFSRQPIAFSAPARTVGRYDVRAPWSGDEASRADLARETKQALAYAAITAALRRDRSSGPFARLGEAMARTVDSLVSLAGFSYAGIDPLSFEPTFKGEDGRLVTFDGLPTRARHLAAFGALPVRALAGAYPLTDPADAEGVVCIDEIELQQDALVQSTLVARLRAALPRVQWIVTTSSPIVASSAEGREVLALRRLPRAREVQLFCGAEARVH
jgi:hypothetical protein